MKKWKTIYKTRYVIDIEFTDEPFLSETRDDQMARMFSIRQESVFRDFSDEKYARQPGGSEAKFDYLESYFPEEVNELYFRMLWLETMVLAHDLPHVRAAFRRAIVDQIVDFERGKVRKRLPVKLGRRPKGDEKTFDRERSKFKDLFIQQALKLWSKGKIASKRGVALAWYAYDDENRGVKMVSKAKHLGFTYEELLENAKTMWDELNNRLNKLERI